MNAKKIIFYFSLLTLAAMVVIFFLLENVFKQDHKLPILGQLTPFALTDSKNKYFSSDELKGKTWLAGFVFTRCSGPCPLLTKRVAGIAKQNAARDDIAFVSVTVDPDFDTPDVLDRYAQKFEADTTRWHFLSGTYEQIQKIMIDDFKLGFADKLIFHSDKLVLVDKQGNIRGYYESTNKDEMEKMEKDLNRVALEP